MKKIVLATAATLALSTSGIAFDLVGENEDILIRIGADIEGSQDDLKLVPSTTNKYTGTEQNMAFELAVGLEEKVEDFKFGTRKMLSLYDDGDVVVHNGGLLTNVSNTGVEATYEVYFKATKYAKPYIGLGFGINQQKVDLDARDGVLPEVTYDRDQTKYTPTAQLVAGITGEFGLGIGYYINAKYRLADKSSTSIPFKEGGGASVSSKIVDVDGVSGAQYIVGLSYQF